MAVAKRRSRRCLHQSRAARVAAVPARRGLLSKALLQVCEYLPLLACLLAGAQPPSHVFGKILERISDRELFHRVPRFGILRERLTQLFCPAEAAAQWKILTQRKAF